MSSSVDVPPRLPASMLSMVTRDALHDTAARTLGRTNRSSCTGQQFVSTNGVAQ